MAPSRGAALGAALGARRGRLFGLVGLVITHTSATRVRAEKERKADKRGKKAEKTSELQSALARKDNFIVDLRQRIEALSSECQQYHERQAQLESQQQVIKKLKGDLERKEQQLQSFRLAVKK